MVSAMRSLGAEVVVLGAADLLRAPPSASPPASLARRSAPTRRLPGYRRVVQRLLVERPRVARYLREALERHRPDIVYERSSAFYDLASATARAAGIPLVLEVNAPLAEEGGRFRHERLAALSARQERRAWRLAYRVTAVSRNLAQRVRDAGQAQVVHVPNAVDHSLFHTGVAPDRALEAGTTGTFSVAFAGTMKPWHDLPTLLRAICLLRPTTDCTLVIVGDGPERGGVQRLAEQLGVRLLMTGAVDHRRVPTLLAAVDACVVPMHPDPRLHYFSPLKAMEYLALGKPTVAADAGDLSDIVRSDAAIGYEPGSARGLAAALARLASDPALSGRLSSRGRELAARHSWQLAARRSLEGLVPLRDPVKA